LVKKIKPYEGKFYAVIERTLIYYKKNICQHTFCAIANFVEIQITEKSNKETTTKRPAMPYAQDHTQNCLKQIQSIENYFKKYSTIDNHNYLLNGLDSLEDIGITIATGLIWSNNRKYRVPFDK
jgi:hypothetical protein